ncbi:uncharacterized protein LOC131257720 isoform X2 [Magnolia sinica]|uniref:uncharacterized protein LOC131257720 isoform X2 n=1 Tax=Magnolia sinica TaxID=86752 RepID=UPI0026585419|nr:uncharacterized protein LOC131257720 isoform X2 [Magnolia sinica]XP_058114526.1 uncharacterized protein LOC131257720 isoform X2 [Magnolia sinica]
MGCLSSKIAARSRSFREELSHSLQRRIEGFPALEDILISKNSGDQFLALVCTANTVAKKLQNGNPSTEFSIEVDPSEKHSDIENINTKVLMCDLEEEEEEEQQQQQQRKERLISSTSFHGPHQSAGEGQCPIQCDNIHAIQDNGPTLDGGSIISTRSIHTVEEYDAMVDASNRWSQIGQDVIVHHSTGNVNDQCVGSSGSSFNDCSAVKEDGIEGDRKEPSTIDNHKPDHAKAIIATVEDGNFTNEKGFQRKAKAKELATLSIPTTVDFPAPGSFGDWNELTNLFSNGDYDTPKFGNFCIANPVCCGGECNVFDPEMLASFEEDMKQLTEEEESILQQIVESLEEESIGKEENKEFIPDQIQV